MIRYYYTFIMIVFIIGFSTGQGKTMNSMQNNKAKAAVNGDFLTYTVHVSESNARCQVLINDVPLMYYEGKGPRSFYANGAILSSGLQSIKIITEGKMPEVTISETKNLPGAYKEMEIWKNNGSAEGEFSATVTYDFEGWRKSDLILANNAAKKQALNWFTQMGQLLKDGKGTEFMEQLIPAEKTAAVLFNLKDEETAKFHSNWIGYINKKEYTLVPVSECKVEVVGNGRLIHLVDEYQEGGFALKADNGQLLLLDIYLHLPAGKGKIEPVLANFKQITSNFKKLSD